MQLLGLSGVVLCLAAALPAEAKEEPLFCAEPAFTVKALPSFVKGDEPQLFSEHEERDPWIGRRLAMRPGPYGHSELGFRYLARVFGYPGKFEGGRAEVERWLAEQEVYHDENRGMRRIWEHWVVNAPKRLSVPYGPVRHIPAKARAEVLFHDLYEQARLSRCIAIDLAVARCEAYRAGQKLLKTDHVYFGKSGGRAACLVKNKGPVDQRAPTSVKVTLTRSTGQPDQKTTKMEWSSDDGQDGKASTAR